MKFLIQKNMINKDMLQDISKAVSPYPHMFIDVIPFSREITSDEPLEGTAYIPYGSTLFSDICIDTKFIGAHQNLSVMNYRNFLLHRSDMLNDNVMSVGEAAPWLRTLDPDTEFFTRPSEDTKQYSGQVMTSGEIASWLESMMGDVGGGSYYMDPKTEIILSKPKDISVEWRWFIVGGKIISGAMYLAHNQLCKHQELDEAVIDEAQILADKWLPMDCVVMDTALVDDTIKVIEFNCINSSGFYASDIDAVFKALWEYHNQ